MGQRYEDLRQLFLSIINEKLPTATLSVYIRGKKSIESNPRKSAAKPESASPLELLEPLELFEPVDHSNDLHA